MGDSEASADPARDARCASRVWQVRSAMTVGRRCGCCLGVLLLLSLGVRTAAAQSALIARTLDNCKISSEQRPRRTNVGAPGVPANPFNTSSIATTVAALRSCGHDLTRLVVVPSPYSGLLNRCVLDEPVSGRSCQATMPPARCASVGVWGNCASVTPFAECESVCLVTVAADPTSSAGSVAALPLGRSDRR